MDQWLAMLPQSKKMVQICWPTGSLSMGNLCFSMPAGVSFHSPKTCRLAGNSELSIGVNRSVNFRLSLTCDRLTTCTGCTASDLKSALMYNR